MNVLVIVLPACHDCAAKTLIIKDGSTQFSKPTVEVSYGLTQMTDIATQCEVDWVYVVYMYHATILPRKLQRASWSRGMVLKPATGQKVSHST